MNTFTLHAVCSFKCVLQIIITKRLAYTAMDDGEALSIMHLHQVQALTDGSHTVMSNRNLFVIYVYYIYVKKKKEKKVALHVSPFC